MKKELINFINKYELKVDVLFKQANEAYFDATISGKDGDYKKAADLQIKLNKIYTNKDDFAFLKKIKESNFIKDELLNRQLDVLYREYRKNQVDEKKLENIIKLGNEIEKKYSIFRANINGKTLTDNDIDEILISSTNGNEVKKAWLASKEIGSVVANDVIKIVKMRNEVAHELGFDNYHEMSLTLDDQNPDDIDKLFDELDSLTKNVFAEVKNKIDDFLSKRFNISKKELMPWHYQNRYFQEAPKIYNVDFDNYFKDKNIVELTKIYYKSIGLPVDSIVAQSDLFEKEGKYQHAYCTHIDKHGDVRVVCNIKNNANWMNTMLHEFGHAVYDKYMDMNIPYVLCEPAHIFTTEAIAMMFGRFATNTQWLTDVVEINEKEQSEIADDSYNSLRLEQLVFSRWAQVMYRFEKSMYKNPDQDLNILWWDLVEKYQLLQKPEARDKPDWASKIHIATVPCYYHNYLLGELLASQLYFYIIKNIIKSDDYKNQSFANNIEVGKYLKEKIFDAADKYYWNNMIEKATGEKLTAKYYAKQFVD